MQMKLYFVYIMASRRRAIYIGVTNDVYRRSTEHATGQGSIHTSRYLETRLVYFEVYGDPSSAIVREKQIKSWRRSKKVALIEAGNPGWRDLRRNGDCEYIAPSSSRA